jgi:hypothetical protein
MTNPDLGYGLPDRSLHVEPANGLSHHGVLANARLEHGQIEDVHMATLASKRVAWSETGLVESGSGRLTRRKALWRYRVKLTA